MAGLEEQDLYFLAALVCYDMVAEGRILLRNLVEKLLQVIFHLNLTVLFVPALKKKKKNQSGNKYTSDYSRDRENTYGIIIQKIIPDVNVKTNNKYTYIGKNKT